MTNQELLVINQAIKESMEQTIDEFGPEFIRTLSWFPSAEEAKEKLLAA